MKNSEIEKETHSEMIQMDLVIVPTKLFSGIQFKKYQNCI